MKNSRLLKPILLLAAFFAVVPLPVLGFPVSLKTDGNLLYVANKDGTIEVWDARSGSLEERFQTGIPSFSFEKDGTSFYIGSSNRFFVLDLTGHVVKEINVSGSTVISSIALDKDYSRLYTGSWDNTIRVWNMEDWSLERAMEEHKLPVSALALDDRYLYSASVAVKVWDRQTLAFVKNLTTQTDWKTARREGYPIVSIIVEDDKIYTGHINGNIRIWDLTTDSLVKEVEAHPGDVTGLATDGQYIYSIGGSREKTVKIWTMEGDPTGMALKTEKSTRLVAIDENYLYVGVYEEGVLVYDKNYRNLVNELGSFIGPPPGSGEQQVGTQPLNPTLPIIVAFALFLIIAVVLETYVGVKKKHGKLTTRGVRDFLMSFVTIEDILKILILSSIIIFAIGTINTTSIFPSYVSGLQAIYYFDILVRRGAFLPVWFLLLPSVTYWATKKYKRRMRYLATALALLVAVVIYLVAPTVL